LQRPESAKSKANTACDAKAAEENSKPNKALELAHETNYEAHTDDENDCCYIREEDDEPSENEPNALILARDDDLGSIFGL